MNKYIKVKGARANNLKNIDVSIPRDKFVVLTGLSGSGKSSLAFDTIYAEGHRRFVESLSSYARQFLGQLDKPEVDGIEGLSPAIAIDQKTTSKNPRSTVGTVTEIYDYLRLLYSRTGIAHCPVCGKEIIRRTVDSIIEEIMSVDTGTKFMILSPVVRAKKGTHEKIFENAKKSGYARVRVDGSIYDLSETINLDKNLKHTVDVVIDRLVMKEGIRPRVADSVEAALKLSDGSVTVLYPASGEIAEHESSYNQNYACDEHGTTFPELSPRMFSFNNPLGACPECAGLGEKSVFSPLRLIPDKSLSLKDGAINCNGFKSLDEDSWNGPFFELVGKDFGFTLNTPIKDFSKKAFDVLLYGNPDKIYTFDSEFEGVVKHRHLKFEGIIKMLEQRYAMGQNEYYEQFIDTVECPKCKGRRLKDELLSVTVGGKNIDEFCRMSIEEALVFVENLKQSKEHEMIARDIIIELKARLSFLVSVGLEYLTLARKSGTLSGGEAQRIRLATQIGSALMGVIYILDEPSIGLHQRDNSKLIATLKKLRDTGNTVLVVEHDEETMIECDYIIDIGPGAGIHGGEVVAAGTPGEIMKNKNSITGAFLAGKRKISIPEYRREGNGCCLSVKGAALNNLKNVDVDIPLGKMVCVTGVSGSGKSSLVNGIIYPHLASKLNGAHAYPGPHKEILGVENLDKVIGIDQSPIGRTPRSNPATYIGVFTDIRDLMAKTPDSMKRGYNSGRFSFNVKGGRCEACEGDGVKRIEMHFLPDVYVTCPVCKGHRYNQDTLEVKYKGKNIADILEMTVEESVSFFENHPKILRKVQTLFDVGLGYLKLGQSSTTLSGGEAQRVKLASELSKRGTGKTFYILDEPTTGLHTADVEKLLAIIDRLADNGNTVLIIEHNLDVINTAHYITDMGPEGGSGGGTVVASGTPEEIAEVEASYTGQFLKKVFEFHNSHKDLAE